MYGQRQTDNDPVKKLWNASTPYVQVVGFVILCSFIAGTLYTTFQSYGSALASNSLAISDHERRINGLESGNAQINQKLDDMISFFQVPHKKTN